MQHPLISIIITVLNGAKTLPACLESIACQSFTDYEVIIVDGGSIDGTLEIIDAAPIQYITSKKIPGIGLYAGLNTGIDMATGEWYYFMGCDDLLYDSSVLSRVADAINDSKHDIRVITGGVHYAQSNYTAVPKTASPYALRYWIHHQGTFYEKSVFSETRYNETFLVASDYELNLKLALAGVPHKRIQYIISVFGERGVSSQNPQLGFIEVQKIHKRLFNEPARIGILSYFWIRHKMKPVVNMMKALGFISKKRGDWLN